MTKILTFIKPKGRKRYICCFLQYQILNKQKRINHDENWYYVKQPILASANSYCNFHILFIHKLYATLSIVKLHTVLSMFRFLFNWSHLKAGTVHSSDLSLSRKRSIIGQVNVTVATAENEEQYTLSNIIYTGFQNAYTFLWSFFC